MHEDNLDHGGTKGGRVVLLFAKMNDYVISDCNLHMQKTLGNCLCHGVFRMHNYG